MQLIKLTTIPTSYLVLANRTYAGYILMFVSYYNGEYGLIKVRSKDGANTCYLIQFMEDGI